MEKKSVFCRNISSEKDLKVSKNMSCTCLVYTLRENKLI